MQEDEKPARRGAGAEQDRHFEMPRLVREVRPGDPAPPALTPAEAEPDDSGSAAPDEPGARFARRWDQVQTAFVRRARGAAGNAGRPPRTTI